MKRPTKGYFHKAVFERISDQKRERVFESAMREFAAQGYVAANINTIAENAGISIGAMYTYFPSKENLYLAISERGVEIYREIIGELDMKQDFYGIVEQLFHLAIRYARTHADISRMYLELTTHQMRGMAARLAEKMEMDLHNLYVLLLTAGQKNGEVRTDVNLGLAAKILDDCVLSLQLSASVFYYEERQQQYAGTLSDDELIAGMMDLVRRYLRPEMPAAT